MLKKLFLSVFAIVTCVFSLHSAPLKELPPEFYVKERFLSWTTTFDVETPTEIIGDVRRKFFSWTNEYHFHDNTESLQAKAKQRFFSWGVTFDVTDNQQQPIGTVEEKIFRFFPTFQIVSPEAQILCTAKLNFWGTKYTIRHPVDERPIAELSRPFFRLFTDKWTVKIFDPFAFQQLEINPTLFITVMAFQTDFDHWRQAQYAMQNNSASPLPQEFVASSTNESELWTQLEQQLESYRHEFEGIEPTAEDFDAIEALTDSLLDHQDGADLFRSEAMRVEHGQNVLITLFEDEALSLSEKSALFLMLQQKVQQAQNSRR